MRSLHVILVLACVIAASEAKARKESHIHITPKTRALLAEVDANHMRYYPDFQYEGFPEPHAPQPKDNLNRVGTGPHDVLRKNESTPNPHMANKTTPYPKNLLWLLNMFEQGYGIPRSYNDILPNGMSYWGTETYLSVGAFDEFGNATELDSMIAIQERTLTRYGLNLYDAGVWEIALSLWWNYEVAAIYEMNILYAGTTGPAGTKGGNPGGLTDIRADGANMLYGGSKKTPGSSLTQITYAGNVTHFPAVNGEAGTPTKKGPGSFFYRMIGPKYLMIDPMSGPYGQAWKYPWPNYDSTTPWNTFGMIHFNDWKPITGENVWGNILGPLQALGLRTNNNLTNFTCGNHFRRPKLACDWKKFETTPPPVQQAISIIPALLALQTTQGAIYHCPWGAKIFPPDPEEGNNVSNENCFSSYASLNVLYWVLTNYTANTESTELKWALKQVTSLREGLQKWFDAPSILSPLGQLPNNEQVVPQGGHINSSGYFPVPLNTIGGLAIDCQTWGMTVMGQPRIDKNFGEGFAYKIWQTAKKYAGYYKGPTLCGVGYTDLASKNHSSIPVNTIWSAEWTFGAINMAQVLAQQYEAAGHSDKAQSLLQDGQSMYNQVVQLWPQGLRFPDGSYVYANKRFFIPWGWFSNPISALCSTAWSVLQARNFDPFHWGGGNKPPLLTPPTMIEEADENWQ